MQALPPLVIKLTNEDIKKADKNISTILNDFDRIISEVEQQMQKEKEEELRKVRAERVRQEELALELRLQKEAEELAVRQQAELNRTWSVDDANAWLSQQTGVSKSTWDYITFAESSNNPNVVNSVGCYGLYQIHPVHGIQVGADIKMQAQYALKVYRNQGLRAWEVVK